MQARFKRATFFCIAVATLLASLISSAHAATSNQIKSEKSLSLVFVGDIVLDGKAGEHIQRGADPFKGVKRIFESADLRIANLECVVALQGEVVDKNFNFRAHPRTLPYLAKYVDAVSIANNHSGDFGPKAFSEMLTHLQQHQIGFFGGGNDLQQAHKPFIIEKNGYRIALLGYNEFMPRSFEATAKDAGVAWSEDEQVAADIRDARSVYSADIVIPFMHWGWENELRSGPRQRALARKMIDAGADAVIGGHPHVIQDTEEYKGKPIIYSLGNFMIDAMDNANQARGWAVRLELKGTSVQRWQTQLIQLDEEGIPNSTDELSACWSKEKGLQTQCKPFVAK
ncbi:CapA family protein [Undibacterium cyanobacteriorum]|uniref:CapA family protein n=1 Tax=Undibacterium cyanobacteriorum TaxID=3073561 RepID=A0ABY9RE72_9BURK|nr:CapA family protein [Undibacterium sp. 20NA77.5]WMW79168.1 CapA family protein [Undibacterium sp. 20NA77.5]